MKLEAHQIAQACGCALPRAENWRVPLNEALEAFRIDEPAHVAAFLAQVGHESGRLAYVREIWGPTLAQRRYEWRVDLGNTHEGDGYRYMGRGLIQVTGRANYQTVRDGMRMHLQDVPDFEAEPQKLEAPRWAALSAAYFWTWKRLGQLVDAGDFVGVTRRINGGTNGLSERQALWASAKAALGVA